MSNDPNQQYGGQQYGGQQYGGQEQYGEQQYGQPVQPPPGQMPPGQMPPGYYQPQPQPKKRSTCMIIGLIVGALLVVCIGGTVALGLWGKGEVDDAVAVIDQFMQAGEDNDPAAGISHFSTIATNQGPDEAEIATFFANRELFDGYESIAFPNNFNANSSTGKGTVTQVEGTVKYSTGSGTYNAQLERSDNGWKIVRIDLKR